MRSDDKERGRAFLFAGGTSWSAAYPRFYRLAGGDAAYGKIFAAAGIYSIRRTPGWAWDFTGGFSAYKLEQLV